VLARLADAAPRDPAPRIVVPSQNIRFDPLSDRMANPYVKAAGIAALVISLGFAAMYWWVFIRHTAPVAAARKPEASPALSPSTAPPSVPVASAVQADPPKTIAVAPAPDSPKAPSAKAAEPAKIPAEPAKPAAEPAKPTLAMALSRPVASSEPGGVLKFRFKGKSWVEIRDARGKVLMTGLNDPGSETEVSGKPPFKVVVGNASEVRMFFNDRELSLEPHMREAVARVTVE
jgi:cytoskeleton protein RodZ